MRDAGNVILAMQGTGEAAIGDHTERYPSVLLPIAVLRDAAAGVAAVNIHPDPDGRVRYSQLLIEGPDGTTYYSLPLLTAAKKVRADLSSARRTDDILTVPAPLGDRVMPIDRRGGMSIYYAAPPSHGPSDCTDKSSFCVVSMKDVINGTVPRELITGRAIFIGAHSLSGVPDSYPVPNSSGDKMFGVEIWANAAQSILTNRYPVLKQSDLATEVQLFVVTLAGLVLVLRWRLYGFIAALALLVAYVVGAYIVFSLETQGTIGPVPSRCPRSRTWSRRCSGGSSCRATCWSKSRSRWRARGTPSVVSSRHRSRARSSIARRRGSSRPAERKSASRCCSETSAGSRRSPRD